MRATTRGDAYRQIGRLVNRADKAEARVYAPGAMSPVATYIVETLVTLLGVVTLAVLSFMEVGGSA